MTDQTLNQALAARGWTTEPSPHHGTKRVRDEGGWYVGDLTASQTADVLTLARGHINGAPQMVEPGHDPNADGPRCRHAIKAGGWLLYEARDPNPVRKGATPTEAILWVARGVLS
jgi:hypothetical protein